MKTRFSLMLLAVLCSLVAPIAFAQSPNGAEKAAAASSDVTQFAASVSNVPIITPFVTVVSTNIKPPGGKDLSITFSAQTLVVAESINDNLPALPFTFTFENVAIQARVLLDGNPVAIAPPSPLSILSFDNMVRETVRFTPGQVDFLTLVTEEGGARSYTWIARNVGVGDHKVEVQARFILDNARFPLGTTFSEVLALIGPKTLLVEEIMLK